ncbi:Ger(x)C family spore germination C-terminal domain-containing protein [Paenibacillus sp. R14(2021)]|uniref:Ger(x)C family spore germination protein n=1 Tax=Paenibacillus sp. R14(2021) TaxID=2859228 RepID=UPI001C612125|nr:Ger(x)C family spore germination C-terminal domain-containing protein [Paenibacillus sp. R14(2021)]
MKEINQLAIVNIGSVDKDPKTGRVTAIFQIVNPSGVSAKGGGSTKASVYSYKFEESSLGRITEITGTAMPRLLFAAHMQCYIVTERYARLGLTDMINFLERNPERRTNVLVLVTDSPLSEVLNTFTPLEIVPGRFFRSLLDLNADFLGSSASMTRMKDLAEGISTYQPAIVPIVHFNGTRRAASASRLDDIDARKNGLNLTDSAVIVKGRMVGRIDREMQKIDYILNHRATKSVFSLNVKGSRVDVQAYHIQVGRKQDHANKRLTFRIRADLTILNNQQTSMMTLGNLHDVEQAFNSHLIERANDLIKLAKKNRWDLLGLQNHRVSEEAWLGMDFKFQTESKVTMLGNTIKPYNSRENGD